MLLDSAEIQEDDIKYVNKKNAREGKPYIEPLYRIEDAKRAVDQLTPVPYGNWHRIDKDVEVMFTDAGHIIGSACVHLRIMEDGKSRQITFSGDIGRYGDPILKSPEVFPQADYIIMESTYGSSLHEDIAPTDDILLKYIHDTCIGKRREADHPRVQRGPHAGAAVRAQPRPAGGQAAACGPVCRQPAIAGSYGSDPRAS